MNETNWNKFDDKFFMASRKWFDRWKDFISYDYIVKLVVELGRPEAEVSSSRVLSNNSNPGEISNFHILHDLKEHFKNRAVGLSFCNRKLRADVVPERDLIFFSEPIWKLLYGIYGGIEVCRYAVTKSPASILDRQSVLPVIHLTLVLFKEHLRSPRILVVPHRTKYRCLKAIVRESVPWLRDLTDDDIRFWQLSAPARDTDFIEQYNT